LQRIKVGGEKGEGGSQRGRFSNLQTGKCTFGEVCNEARRKRVRSTA